MSPGQKRTATGPPRVAARPSIAVGARRPAFVSALALASAIAGAACGQSAESRPSEPAPISSTAASASSTASVAAPPALLDPNPFKLPSRTLELDAGRRVFAVSEQTLAGAKLGSTMILHASTVTGFDGELLVIEGHNGPPYKVHAGYAIAVPDKPSIRPGEPVITERNGILRHAVVKKHVRDRVTVRFTEEGGRLGELVLKNTRFIRQSDGLLPGNYAALGDGETLRHVLLVSSFDDGEKKWLVLGTGGAAMIAQESALEAIPVKYQPRAGTPVLAEHNGILRRATIQSASEPGLFTVKYERAGRPATLGWGFVLPVAPDRGGGRAPAPAAPRDVRGTPVR